MGNGENYKYAHSYDGNFFKQAYLPQEIKKPFFYKPQDNDNETRINKVA